MEVWFLDASAWSKRYTAEYGQDVVNAAMDEAGAGRIRLISSAISYAEVASAIVRLRNRESIDDRTFMSTLARMEIEREWITWLPVPEDSFRACVHLIIRHNLNATDAAILTSLLVLKNSGSPDAGELRLITADRRFVRAAAAEGLQVLDPEASSPREVHELANQD